MERMVGVGAGDGVAAPPAALSAGGEDWAAGPVSAALGVVAGAVDGLLGADLGLAGTAGLLGVLRGVERECRRLAAVSVAVIAQVEQRGLAGPAGSSSTAGLVR